MVATGFNNGHPASVRPMANGSPSLFDNAPKKNLNVSGNGTPIQPVKELVDSSVNDDEFDIPAFIRRKMK